MTSSVKSGPWSNNGIFLNFDVKRSIGLRAALASAFFLGLSPIFGRQAILQGFPPLGAVAVRTLAATTVVFLALLLFNRRYLYIYPAGLLGCLLAGGINGAGSLLFYTALARLNASVGQLLNSTYPLFVALWLTLDRQPPGKLTLMRLALAVPAVYLLVQAPAGEMDPAGVLMMLGAAALYALHLPINQRVLYEMPAPTVTLYTLAAMTAVVVPAYFTLSRQDPVPAFGAIGWLPVLGLTLVTLFSRLMLFTGVKHIGGMQTAIIGLLELLVTMILAFAWLGERLHPVQWAGAVLLMAVVGLVSLEGPRFQRAWPRGWLRWLSP